MATESSRAEDLAKLNKLIKGVKTCMMTTTDADGSLHSRPMATQEAQTDGDVWFFTYASSGKVDEVKHDQHVNLSYAEPSDSRYVSLTGSARLVRDKEKAKELWSPALKAWFPKGLDDPNLALLKVTIERAEYWDTPAGAMVKAYGMVKALVTGKAATADDVGDHKKMDLGK